MVFWLVIAVVASSLVALGWSIGSRVSDARHTQAIDYLAGQFKMQADLIRELRSGNPPFVVGHPVYLVASEPTSFDRIQPSLN